MASDNGVLLIAEIEKRYPDEWLLFEVVETDEQNQPVKGRLLAHSAEHDVVEEAMLQADCYHTYYYYNGEPQLPAVLRYDYLSLQPAL